MKYYISYQPQMSITIGNKQVSLDIEVLYLHNNQLQSLPDSIGNLRTLQGLYLNNNQLQYLPESILSLSSIQHLSLSNNPLSPSTLSITPSKISSLNSRRTFLKCYFALALNCPFLVVESILINNQN
jgi:Leucine-rich repeat (LRR) protein